MGEAAVCFEPLKAGTDTAQAWRCKPHVYWVHSKVCENNEGMSMLKTLVSQGCGVILLVFHSLPTSFFNYSTFFFLR